MAVVKMELQWPPGPSSMVAHVSLFRFLSAPSEMPRAVFCLSPYSQRCLIRTLWGIVKTFKLEEARMADIRIMEVLLGDIQWT